MAAVQREGTPGPCWGVQNSAFLGPRKENFDNKEKDVEMYGAKHRHLWNATSGF